MYISFFIGIFYFRHFFFTAMLFVYGRILSPRLVNTVTSDMVLYRLVSSLIKYHMVICYALYIAGDLCISILSFIVHLPVLVQYLYQMPEFHASFIRIVILFAMFHYVGILMLWLSLFLLIGLRIYVVHSHIKEEDVQVPIWPVCLDTHDSHCCIWAVLLHCGKHFWRDFLVIWSIEGNDDYFTSIFSWLSFEDPLLYDIILEDAVPYPCGQLFRLDFLNLIRQVFDAIIITLKNGWTNYIFCPST